MRAMAVVASALVLASCGRVSPAPEGDPPAIDAPDEVSDVEPARCPVNEPMRDTPCDDETLACSYGDSPVARCRRLYECLSGKDAPATWRLREPVCDEPPGGCPASPATGECSPDAGYCALTDGTLCWCRPGDAAAAWSCMHPEPSCPTFVPNAGAPCSTTASCTYGITVRVPGCAEVLLGVRASCNGGTWVWFEEGCSDK